MDEPRMSVELRSTRERHAPFFIEVYDTYEVIDGSVELADWRAANRKRKYFPLSATSSAILADFYKVVPGDESSALRFISSWGSLGFEGVRHETAGPPSSKVGPPSMGSDPLPWIWIHANGVRIAMDLLRLLNRGLEPEIGAYLGRLRLTDAQILAESRVARAFYEWRHRGQRPDDPQALVKDASAMFDGGAPGELSSGSPTLVCGARDLSSRPTFPGAAFGPPSATAAGIVARIINPNLRGAFTQVSPVTPFLDEGDNRSLTLTQGADSLMSIIYQHLTEMVLRGRIFTCRECGTPFVRRAGRGSYCPPPPWSPSRSSRCYERAKKRKQRTAT